MWVLRGHFEGSQYLELPNLPRNYEVFIAFNSSVTCRDRMLGCSYEDSDKNYIEKSEFIIDIDYYTSTPDYLHYVSEEPQQVYHPRGWYEHELIVLSENDDAIKLSSSLAPCNSSENASNVEVIEFARDDETFSLESMSWRADFTCKDGSRAKGVEFTLRPFAGEDLEYPSCNERLLQGDCGMD